MISEGHGIMNKTTRESALGIKLKIVEIEEFGGLSYMNVKDLVEYLKEIRNLSEVRYLYIVYFVCKFQGSFKFPVWVLFSFFYLIISYYPFQNLVLGKDKHIPDIKRWHWALSQIYVVQT